MKKAQIMKDINEIKAVSSSKTFRYALQLMLFVLNNENEENYTRKRLIELFDKSLEITLDSFKNNEE